MATLGERFPWLVELTLKYLNDPAILDLRLELARAKALCEVYLFRVDLDGDPAELLKAVEALETVVRIALQVIKAQQRMGAILPEDVSQLIYVFRLTIREFIPREQYGAVEEYMRQAGNELAGRLLHRSQGVGPEVNRGHTTKQSEPEPPLYSFSSEVI